MESVDLFECNIEDPNKDYNDYQRGYQHDPWSGPRKDARLDSLNKCKFVFGNRPEGTALHHAWLTPDGKLDPDHYVVLPKEAHWCKDSGIAIHSIFGVRDEDCLWETIKPYLIGLGLPFWEVNGDQVTAYNVTPDTDPNIDPKGFRKMDYLF